MNHLTLLCPIKCSITIILLLYVDYTWNKSSGKLPCKNSRGVVPSKRHMNYFTNTILTAASDVYLISLYPSANTHSITLSQINNHLHSFNCVSSLFRMTWAIEGSSNYLFHNYDPALDSMWNYITTTVHNILQGYDILYIIPTFIVFNSFPRWILYCCDKHFKPLFTISFKLDANYLYELM